MPAHPAVDLRLQLVRARLRRLGTLLGGGLLDPHPCGDVLLAEHALLLGGETEAELSVRVRLPRVSDGSSLDVQVGTELKIDEVQCAF